MTRLAYGNNCVNWPRRYVADLTTLCDTAGQIKAETFLRRVDLWDLDWITNQLGYTTRYPITDDPYVTYWSGKLWGRRVYFFTWSSIEYVFAPTPILKRIRR